MCGIFGMIHAENASYLTSLGLFALQHRGQESAGISCLLPDEEIETHKQHGLVSEVFSSDKLLELKGKTAIGHVRYGTAGRG